MYAGYPAYIERKIDEAIEKAAKDRKYFFLLLSHLLKERKQPLL